MAWKKIIYVAIFVLSFILFKDHVSAQGYYLHINGLENNDNSTKEVAVNVNGYTVIASTSKPDLINGNQDLDNGDIYSSIDGTIVETYEVPISITLDWLTSLKYYSGFVDFTFSIPVNVSNCNIYSKSVYTNSNNNNGLVVELNNNNQIHVMAHIDNVKAEQTFIDLGTLYYRFQIYYNINVSNQVSVSLGSVSFTNTGRFVISDNGSGLQQTIIDAINNALEIQTIIYVLDQIWDDTDLLSSVLSGVNNLDSKLVQIIGYLQTDQASDTTRNNLLSALLLALSGSTNTSGLPESARQYWIGIIQEAFDLDPDDQEAIEEQQGKIEDVIGNNHDIEDEQFQAMDSGIDDFENSGTGGWNPIKPGSIVAAITPIKVLINLLYNQLGNLQYLITVTITIGLAVMILGKTRFK